MLGVGEADKRSSWSVALGYGPDVEAPGRVLAGAETVQLGYVGGFEFGE